MSTDKLRIAVFISGGGTNLQALIDACAVPGFPAEIVLVISNVPDAYGLKRAEKAGVPHRAIDHRHYANRGLFEDALHEALLPYAPDLICLAGFMRILTPNFISKWDGRILNTHPSLLPKHGGPGMFGEHVHRAVLQSGDTISGCTIHYVIPDVDKGRILVQKSVPVDADDTPDTLAQKVLEQEHRAYPEAIEKIALEKSRRS